MQLQLLLLLISVCCSVQAAFQASLINKAIRQPNNNHSNSINNLKMVSELHIPQYKETKKPFILEDEIIKQQNMIENDYKPTVDYESMIPYQDGFLCHKTTRPLFTAQECQSIIDEAEDVCANRVGGWTTKRHGNYPTTDIPIVELPGTMEFLREALYTRVYPLLREQFQQFLPDGRSLRVADGFVVKYDADGGQSELKPHRDGSVLSFNIALNPAADFEGGGTWFQSLQDAVKIDQGEVCSHASGVLHGGHGITSGKRYILVAFVIVENYDAWSMRFYNQVRDL